MWRVRVAAGMMAAATVVGSTVSLAGASTPQVGGGESQRAPQVAAAKPSRTVFSVALPWSDGSVRRAIAAKSVTRAAGDCFDSSLSDRRDGYRCGLGNYIYDPCFVNPRSSRQVACPDSGRRTGWIVATNVRTSRWSRGVSARAGWLFQVRLVNGAVCSRASGAFPVGPRAWPYGAGACRGGPFGSEYLMWRSGPRSSKSNAYHPLVSIGRGRWAAAVEGTNGKVALYPVQRAWR